MIGVEVGKKCNIALFPCSVINSKGRKLDCDSTTVLLPGSAFAVLTVWNSRLEFICNRRRNKQGSLLAIRMLRILSPFHLHNDGSLISSEAMRIWITKKCSGLKKSTFGDYFDDCLIGATFVVITFDWLFLTVMFVISFMSNLVLAVKVHQPCKEEGNENHFKSSFTCSTAQYPIEE